MANPIRVAACHAAPVFLNAAATTQKAISLIHAASRNAAHLVVFPETYISAFPVWSALRPPTQNHALFARMAASSVYADGPEVASLQSAARATKTYVSIGISERARSSTATLFNSNLIIGPDGRVLVHHRKLQPTFFEKLTWAPGDGAGLRVVQTPWGNVGALICGENTNPLARYALMAQAEQLHVSTWPAVWPTRVEDAEEGGATENANANGGKGKNYDNVTANRTRAAAHCFEAKAFGVLCAGHLDESAITAIASDIPSVAATSVTRTLRAAPRGVTMFLDPTGAPVVGYTVRAGQRTPAEYLQADEDTLYAELDLAECVEGKQFHDVVGGYQRHDVFKLSVNRERDMPVRFKDPVEEMEDEV